MTTQSQRKKARLLEASRELFLERGYRDVLVDEIAKKAGISKVTLYRHFPSKEDLYVQIVHDLTDEHYDKVEREISTLPGAVQKLECLLQMTSRAYDQMTPAFLRDMLSDGPTWPRIYAYRRDRATCLLRTILSEGVASGQLRPLDVEATISLLLALGQALPGLCPSGDPALARRFMNNYYAFVLNALCNPLDVSCLKGENDYDDV